MKQCRAHSEGDSPGMLVLEAPALVTPQRDVVAESDVSTGLNNVMFGDIANIAKLYDVMMTKAKPIRAGGERKRTECSDAIFSNANKPSASTCQGIP